MGKKIQSQLPKIDGFVAFEGVEALKEVYLSQLTAETVFVVRSQNATIYDNTFGEWWTEYMERRREKNIAVHALTPDDPAAIHDEHIDYVRNIFRTWVHPLDYTSPVEIDIFGDTIAVIVFGRSVDTEVTGFTLTNSFVAKALKDIFKLAVKGAKSEPVKHDHAWSLTLTN